MHLLATQLLRFFLPWACASCRTALGSLEDEGFCGMCWLRLPRINNHVCFHCGIPLLDGGNTCFSCKAERPRLLVRAATIYKGRITQAIHRFKYAGRRSLSKSFGTLLKYGWDRYPELHDIQVIVPVPLFSSKERVRGFNQAALLGSELANAISRPFFPALLRHRHTRSQYQLNRFQRRMNVQNAFQLDPYIETYSWAIKGRSFLLIDDVCTTLSTLESCAYVLRRAGARSVKALVLSRDL